MSSLWSYLNGGLEGEACVHFNNGDIANTAQYLEIDSSRIYHALVKRPAHLYEGDTALREGTVSRIRIQDTP